MKRPAVLLTALLSSAALTLTACSAEPGDPASDATPSIVVTTTQLGDFTRQLVGDEARVTQLVQPNQSAHHFDPSAAQLLEIRDADVLVVNGAGLEEWLEETVDSAGFGGPVVDASAGIALSGESHDDDHGHDHGDEADHDESDHDESDHDDHGHEGSEHGGEADDTTKQVKDAADHDHDHEDGNPHIWTDPHIAEHMVENVAHGLSDALPELAGTIEANEQALLAQLAALDGWIHDNIEAVPAAERLLVSNHDAFTYFNDAYGITFVGAIIPSFDDNAEPSAAEIDELVARIAETGARAVFAEASLSPKSAETIAREAGVEVFAGDRALYADSLGPAGSPGESYIGSQVHNVRMLLESWGATATELPAELRE